jgi:DUF3054 family protein
VRSHPAAFTMTLGTLGTPISAYARSRRESTWTRSVILVARSRRWFPRYCRGMVRRQRGPGWLGVDVVCVLVFCAVGRRSHDEGINVAGVATTAWPFLSGTILGWVASQAWRRPTALAPTGVVVWLCTVAVGMLLRKATSAGVAASFAVVALSVTALLLLGWRAVTGVVSRRRSAS